MLEREKFGQVIWKSDKEPTDGRTDFFEHGTETAPYRVCDIEEVPKRSGLYRPSLTETVLVGPRKTTDWNCFVPYGC